MWNSWWPCKKSVLFPTLTYFPSLVSNNKLEARTNLQRTPLHTHICTHVIIMIFHRLYYIYVYCPLFLQIFSFHWPAVALVPITVVFFNLRWTRSMLVLFFKPRRWYIVTHAPFHAASRWHKSPASFPSYGQRWVTHTTKTVTKSSDLTGGPAIDFRWYHGPIQHSRLAYGNLSDQWIITHTQPKHGGTSLLPEARAKLITLLFLSIYYSYLTPILVERLTTTMMVPWKMPWLDSSVHTSWWVKDRSIEAASWILLFWKGFCRFQLSAAAEAVQAGL